MTLLSPLLSLLLSCHTSAALPTAADTGPTTLYEYDLPIVELNRMHQRDGWAPRRFSKKIPKILLGLVRFGNLALQEIRQNSQYELGERRSVMPPTPNRHTGHPKEPSRAAIAAKHHIEDPVVAASGQTALKTRRCY